MPLTHTLLVQGGLYVAIRRARVPEANQEPLAVRAEGSSWRLCGPRPIGAEEQPFLRFEGRVTYVLPGEMLVALDGGGVVTNPDCLTRRGKETR